MIKSIIDFFNNVEKYGEPLGSYNNVISYSNNSNNNLEENYIKNNYCGIKWQCVEYVRRYLILKHSITFEEVEYAYQIFYLYYFRCLLSGTNIKFYTHINGSCFPPKRDSLIVWSYKYNNTGHVAIVTEVNINKIESTKLIKNNVQEYYIKIIEQNWNDKKWKDNYSRKIRLIYDNHYWIKDEYILGWINF